MNKILNGIIAALIILVALLKVQNYKLNNEVLELKLEIEEKNSTDLSITNKTLEKNVKVKTNQIKLIKYDISDADFTKWVQLFKAKRNNKDS